MTIRRLAVLLLLDFILFGCGDVEMQTDGPPPPTDVRLRGDVGLDGGVDAGPICNNPEPCATGEIVMTADYWCRSATDPPDTGWGHCLESAHLDGYYSGLPCPFDIAIAHTQGWTGPCDGCIDGAIIVNGGTSTSAAWRATPAARYCCDGAKTVRRLRCGGG